MGFSVRFGFIGVGGHGRDHVHESMRVGGFEIIAICDICQTAIGIIQEMVIKGGLKTLKVYTGSDHFYEEMIRNAIL